jgi:hypothetical protein
MANDFTFQNQEPEQSELPLITYCEPVAILERFVSLIIPKSLMW